MRITLQCLWASLALAAAFGAHAAPPANDSWANRTQIALPFHKVETDIDVATEDPTDPVPPCQESATFSSLWYSYTTGANAEYLSLFLTGYSSPSIIGAISVYTGTPGAFRLVNGGCGSYGQNPNNAQIFGLRLAPNTTYSIEVGSSYDVGFLQQFDLTVAASPTYQVTKIADTADGTCDADCSLREAIGASNANPGAVLVPAGEYQLTRGNPTNVNENLNATGDLDVLKGMGIYGAGMTTTTIDANQLDRALDVLGTQGSGAAHTVIITDLTLANGTLPNNMADPQTGGGLRTSFVDGDFIAVERVTFTGNSNFYGGGGAFLAARGTLRDSRFTGNTSFSDGGGLAFQGIHLDVIGCTFDDNTSSSGSGGGIGGALGTVRVVNSTVSGNHAAFGGAGINAGSPAPIVVRSSTIVFNDVPTFGLSNAGAGIRLATASGSNEFSNNVIAGNTSNFGDDADCAQVGGATLSSHHNHVQHNNNCNFAGTGDVLGTDPLVNPTLANNGGPTRTHSLDPLSPAIDSADPAGCIDASGLKLEFDQRGAGFPRRSGMVCDKGAFENTSPVVFFDGFE